MLKVVLLAHVLITILITLLILYYKIRFYRSHIHASIQQNTNFYRKRMDILIYILIAFFIISNLFLSYLLPADQKFVAGNVHDIINSFNNEIIN